MDIPTTRSMNGTGNAATALHRKQQYFTSLLRDRQWTRRDGGDGNGNDGHRDGDGNAHGDSLDEQYKMALQALESLIVISVPKCSRSNDVLQVNNVQAMRDYVNRLNLDLGKLKIIHVAGTKGKGSTCAMCESMLRESGLKTGLYTSPHLMDVRERIRINGQPIDKHSFVKHFWICWDQLDRTRNDMYPSMATYFRFMTLIAFRFFIEEKVDVAIIEVGLGGRLDATNIIQPVVCGVNSIGFDHVDVLGDTIEKIASEKAGIMKTNVPVITTHAQRPEAMQVFVEHAKSVHAPLYVASDWNDYAQHDKDHNLSVGLSGKHQKWNATLAIALCQEFIHRTRHIPPQEGHSQSAWIDPVTDDENAPQTYPVSDLSPSFRKGLANCKYSGRGQVIQFPDRHTTFYLDSAHTADSIGLCREWYGSEIRSIDTSHIEVDDLDHIDFSDSDEETELLRDIVKNENYSPARQDKEEPYPRSRPLKILVFQFTGGRKPIELLTPLAHGDRQVFDYVVFCPTDSKKTSLTRRVKLGENELTKLEGLRDAWYQASNHNEKVIIHDSINHVLEWLWQLNAATGPHQQQQPSDLRVLVTGSVYLVGDFIRKLMKMKRLQQLDKG